MIQTDLQMIIKDYYPFDLLSDNELSQMVSKATYTTFAENEFIFHEDESVEDLDIYFLVSGLAKNILHQTNGKQFSPRYYYPGDLVGLMVMFTSGEMTFSVQALEDSTVFKLNKNHFFEVMTQNPDFSKVIWDGIGQRLKTLFNEMKEKPNEEDDRNVALLKTRVKDLMAAPVFIRPDEFMSTAAKKMKDFNTYGLVVSHDHIHMEGVVTHDEVLRVFEQSASDCRVQDWMVGNVSSVQSNSFAYEALSYFKNEHVHVLPVLDKNKVIGTITARSLLNLKNSSFLDFTYNMMNTTLINDLIKLGPLANTSFQVFINELLDNGSLAYEVAEMMTNYNDNLYRQLIRFAENEMKVEGYGLPPVNYCFIVMGSQARQEQAFSTDQDNGLILNDYQHLSNRDAIEEYFDYFTNKVNEWLKLAGFPLCTGGIMAKELRWRKSVTEWKQDIEHWKHDMDAEEIQSITMFYDFRPIYGDFSLADTIRIFFNDKAKSSKILQHLLIKDAIRFKIPVKPLGLLSINQKGKRINVKKVGLLQIVYTIRIYAIKYGIKEVNTIKRLDALKEMNAMHPRDVENAKKALHILLYYRLKQNIKELSNGEAVSNEILLGELSKEDKWKLKESIQIANKMQQVIKISFNRNRGI